MKKAAQLLSLKIVLAVVLTLAVLTFATSARAASGNVQVCRPNTSCEIGEFLYNDDYGVVNNATCKFNSRYPDGSTFISEAQMSQPTESDGWYRYEVDTPETEGVYRSTICCTTGGEKLCLDKSFEVEKDTSAVAAAKTLTINDTPTGFLRVRKSPGGIEIGRVSPGESYEFLKEENGWTQIILDDGTGWVLSQYITKD